MIHTAVCSLTSFAVHLEESSRIQNTPKPNSQCTNYKSDATLCYLCWLVSWLYIYSDWCACWGLSGNLVSVPQKDKEDKCCVPVCCAHCVLSSCYVLVLSWGVGIIFPKVVRNLGNLFWYFEIFSNPVGANGPYECSQGGHGPHDMIHNGVMNSKYQWYKRGKKTYVPVVMDHSYCKRKTMQKYAYFICDLKF